NTWDDSFIVDVEKYQADIQVGVSELSDDTNADGWVSPGESAVLTVYPRNDGAVTALGVWAKLIAVDPVVTINSCFVQAEETWVKCSNSCSCEGLFDSTLQDLPAASTSPVPILQIHYTVSIGAPTQPVGFGLGFTDGLGLEWTDAVVVDVVDADVDITVGVVEVTADDNEDGKVSPGENVTLSVYPQNIGTVLAMGLWGRVDVMDEKFDMDSCYARAGEAWGKCDNSCSCHNVFDNLKQDIEPGTTSADAILQINGTWTGQANNAIFFPVTFTDQFQNQFTDSFMVEVEEAQ
ncbi:MAG: hypothetical protein VX938_08405, partial [Myxococcota bacterium]|nr:hypothetical protein [Myxococcota bacterium]